MKSIFVEGCFTRQKVVHLPVESNTVDALPATQIDDEISNLIDESSETLYCDEDWLLSVQQLAPLLAKSKLTFNNRNILSASMGKENIPLHDNYIVDTQVCTLVETQYQRDWTEYAYYESNEIVGVDPVGSEVSTYHQTDMTASTTTALKPLFGVHSPVNTKPPKQSLQSVSTAISNNVAVNTSVNRISGDSIPPMTPMAQCIELSITQNQPLQPMKELSPIFEDIMLTEEPSTLKQSLVTTTVNKKSSKRKQLDDLDDRLVVSTANRSISSATPSKISSFLSRINNTDTVEQLPAHNPANNTLTKQKSYINRKVSKFFGEEYGMIRGTVISYDESSAYYLIEYEDLDREEMTFSELCR